MMKEAKGTMKLAKNDKWQTRPRLRSLESAAVMTSWTTSASIGALFSDIMAIPFFSLITVITGQVMTSQNIVIQ
jgi:hypothetical protein